MPSRGVAVMRGTRPAHPGWHCLLRQILSTPWRTAKAGLTPLPNSPATLLAVQFSCKTGSPLAQASQTAAHCRLTKA